MESDSLTFVKNSDGSYTLNWDREDPNWKFLNKLTADEIKEFVERAIEVYSDNS